MGWKENAMVYLSTNGTTWNRVTDHNRAPISISFVRIGQDSRTVDGTLRRYSVAKKRTFSLSWTMLPSKTTSSYGGRTGLATVDGGWGGEEIESFYLANDGSFKMKLRKGTDEAKAAADGTIEVVTVMITDFSKSIVKRGVIDFWDLDITLEEV